MDLEITDDSFDKQVIDQSKKIPVLVDFWASWCMPCTMLKPLLEKIAKESKGKFVLAKINVEEHQEKASEYGVMSIPSVKLFKGGKIVDEFMGAIPEQQIRQFLARNGI